MAQSGFDRRDVIRPAREFGPRASRAHDCDCLQCRQRARAETFVSCLQLLEHIQARTFLGLLAADIYPAPASACVQFLLNFDAGASDVPPPCRAESARSAFPLPRSPRIPATRFQPRALFFELNFFRRKFFQPDDVALLLQIERGDFVAHAASDPARPQTHPPAPCATLPAAPQIVVPPAATLRVSLPASARCCASAASDVGELFGDASQFLFGDATARSSAWVMSASALEFCDVEFAQAFLVELNPALVPVASPFNSRPALLHRARSPVPVRKAVRATAAISSSHAKHIRGTGFDFLAQLLRVVLRSRISACNTSN